MANWHFEEKSRNHSNQKDSSQSTVQSHGLLTIIEIFVREILQNSRDAINKISNNVKVNFSLKTLLEKDKDDFLKLINFDVISEHLKAIREYQTTIKSPQKIIDTKEILHDKFKLKLLFIDDYGTIGLIGPEFEDEQIKYEGSRSFLRLCRTTGGNEKPEDRSSGGTYGYGKSVLWKHSQLGMVYIYSRLSEPYLQEDGSKHHSRLIGILRLPDHRIDSKPYNGICYYGNKIDEDKQDVIALYDQKADLFAERLGFKPRSHSDFGTSTLIVGFDDYFEEERGDEEVFQIMKGVAETFYWPAIVENSLEVNFILSNDKYYQANPNNLSKIKALIEIFKKGKGTKEQPPLINDIDIKVPKNEEYEFNKNSESKIRLITKIYDEQDPENDELINHLALIRGSGMVVKYEKINATASGKSFHGIVLAGTVLEGKNEEAQKHLDKLLSLSEPVSHDNWDSNSDNLSSWRGARALVKRIRDLYKKKLEELTSEVSNPEGEAAPILSRIFNLDSGDASPTIRSIKNRNISLKRKTESGGDTYYEFGFEIIVPRKKDFPGPKKPNNWKLICEVGPVGEGRLKTIIHKVPVKINSIVVERKQIYTEKDFKEQGIYESHIVDEEKKYFISGITEPLFKDIASQVKVELSIKTMIRE